MKTLLVLLAGAAFVVAQQAVATDAVVKVRAVNHGDAIIPCGQSKIFLDGPDAFVSWVKDNKRVVYRFPINNSNIDERSFNEICYRTSDIKPCRERTSLFLPHVTKDDEGFYRCRIHYNASPAVDFDFQLDIVESPGYPKVYLENGTVVDYDFIGPVPLGTNVTLVCEVDDVSESSVVQWERDGYKVADSELVKPGLHRAVLELRGVQREENGARYACIAQPADVTVPLTKEVEIKMYLPPLSIKIEMNEKYDFEAGSPRVIDCIIKGFIPPPTIEWYLDDRRLKQDSHQDMPHDDMTMSTLTLLAKRSDHNRVLTCRARNEYFDEIFSSSVKLNVGYKPICILKSKNRIYIKDHNSRNTVEKVVCIVEADPPPTSFSWTLSNTRIVTTPVQGTDLPSRFKSVLSWIPRVDDIGKLNCTATNYFGIQEEPCQFDIVPNSTDEGEAKEPYNQGNEFLSNEEMKTEVEINNQKPNVKEIRNSKPNIVDEIDYSEGSHVIETHVMDLRDNAPWWTPLLFLLGSLFLIGVIGYVIGHWILIKWKDSNSRNVRLEVAYSSADRTRSSSLSSHQEPGSYHREPDVFEKYTNQTNITTTDNTQRKFFVR